MRRSQNSPWSDVEIANVAWDDLDDDDRAEYERLEAETTTAGADGTGICKWQHPVPSWYRVRHAFVLVTLLSFDLKRNCYIKNVVLFEENSIFLLPECSESCEW